jgi:GNAT superfamily N-acetyltransferase
MIQPDELAVTGYRISTDIAEMNVETIHRYLSESSYWAKNIPLGVVQRSIRYSLCFGVFQGNEQVGFARMITDRATFGYLADVFILPEHRGRGLSKWLVATIQSHPDLQGLRRWLLGTLDAHGLYAQFGWQPLPETMVSRFMQIHQPDVYQTGNPAQKENE